ncbi:hydroxymethylbilane synthase [Brevibacterium sp. UMB1308A]|uniref:hydroxymethylbilane synthase n=1 Tax=Brevibacterium sp. UMB1308A TaxID=3050608 RepID=UPI00254BF075|nr:hydroxymethylbilane synthase [Brevibacterium sp. UMB1308A]MDK8346669.1 hydroxymethylbilane synthase [Brevibacterium sp. UMB1308B]MDK8712325.1 hydroxymethylbilane synthase [Brevibacterium sp. UMB1308A]
MSLLVLGVSHRTAPMSVLDAFAFDTTAVEQLRSRVCSGEYVMGVVVLATCNRVEIIAEVSGFHGGLADLGSALVDMTSFDWKELAGHMFVRYGKEAYEHLFELTTGLDSMAIGEAQILGQVRTALNEARTAGTLTGDLERAVSRALEVGKRAHSETALDTVSNSLLDTALFSAREHLGEITGARALVVGAGAMSGLAVATLVRSGVSSLTVINRTSERALRLIEHAEELAQELGTDLTTSFTELSEDTLVDEIRHSNLIVSVTGARGTVIGTDTVVKAMSSTPEPHKRAFIDLAMPFDIEHGVADIPHVSLMGLEQLSSEFAQSNLAADSRAVDALAQVRALIRQAMHQVAAEKAASKINPTVVALRKRASQIIESEYSRLVNKLGDDVSDDVQAEIRKSLNRTVDKILHNPTVRVKELALTETSTDYAAALSTLFDLTAAPETSELPIVGAKNRTAKSSPAKTAKTATPAPAKSTTTDGTTPVGDHTLDVVEPEGWTRTVRLGTRRSNLARSQSVGVAQDIAAHTGWRVEIVEVVTEGDVNMTPLANMGGTGVFVSAVRQALLSGKIDIAVHSLKDLPTAQAPGITLAAVPPRVDPSDVLVARDGLTFDTLPQGAVVGTGSPRRAAQMRAARPDLDIRGVRGNVDTRIKYVTDGRLDAVVLAAAGMRRLGRLAEVSQTLTTELMLPAPGQGALAIECRAENADREPFDAKLRSGLLAIHDETTYRAVVAERAILSRAQAGCSAPIGALANVTERSIELSAVMADDAGKLARMTRSVANTGVNAAIDVGTQIADELLDTLGVVPDTLTGANAPKAQLEVKP